MTVKAEVLEGRVLCSVTLPPSHARRDEIVSRVAVTSVYGSVFEDLDGDGRRDRGEPAVAGAQAYVDDNADGAPDGAPGELPLPSSTSSDGSFVIGGVFDGPHSVRIRPPEGLHPPAGGDTSRSLMIRLRRLRGHWFAPEGHVRPIPLTRSPGIEGTVVRDTNGDGEPEPGSHGVVGRRVFLDLDRDGFWRRGEPAARSNRLGRWHFRDTPPGTYRVAVIPGRGYRATGTSGGALDVTVAPGAVTGDVLVGVAPAAAPGRAREFRFRDSSLL